MNEILKWLPSPKPETSPNDFNKYIYAYDIHWWTVVCEPCPIYNTTN